jgi:predicted Zn-dependent peptidase
MSGGRVFARRGAWVLLVCASLLVAMPVAQERPDRAKPPVPEAPPTLDLPAIQKRTLKNGLAVWVIESHEVPIVQANLVIRAGAAYDPPGKFGTASLAAAMLDEGAGARSALELADAVEFLGAALTTTSSFDAAAVRLNVPAARLNDGLGLLADVTLNPMFAEKELERLRQERLTSLLQARDNPAALAGMAFARAVYGPVHRYGTAMIGTEQSLKALSASDLRQFHGAHYQPSNATLLIVGDVTVEAVVPQLEARFGGWTSGAPRTPPPDLPAPPPPAQREVFILDKPDAEQSQVYIGGAGTARSTPDFFPLTIMNTVLGGSFTSRLNQNLREEHGYTYGASSFFDMRLSAGPFIAAAGVQTDKTADAIREIFVELDRIRTPVPPDELARAKTYIAFGFPSEFETTSDLSRKLEELVVYRLADDYFERYVPNVLAVTAEDARRAAGRYIQPSTLRVVVVGDRRAIEPGIQALELGPIRTMTADEVLGR